MVFFTALQSMTSITLLCLVGYVIAWKGWVTPQTQIFIPRLIMNVILPPYLVENVSSHFQREELLSYATCLLVPFLSILATFLFFYALACLVRISKKRRALVAVCAAFSNTLFIGIPVNHALFGEHSITPVLLYYFFNSFLFWAFANFLVANSGESGEKMSAKRVLQQIFSPPLCGMLLGLLLVFCDIKLPQLLAQSCRYLGGMTTPLALIFIGITLRSMDFRKLRMGLDLWVATVGRMAICPTVTLLTLSFIPVPELTRNVFMVQAGLPCMANMPVIAAYYGADKEFCSVAVAVTTMLGMITVPIWLTIIS